MRNRFQYPVKLASSKEGGKEVGAKLATAVRHDNEAAVTAIKNSGVQIITVDDATKQTWATLAEAAANRAASNGVYSRAILDEIRMVLKSARLADGSKK